TRTTEDYLHEQRTCRAHQGTPRALLRPERRHFPPGSRFYPVTTTVFVSVSDPVGADTCPAGSSRQPGRSDRTMGNRGAADPGQRHTGYRPDVATGRGYRCGYRAALRLAHYLPVYRRVHPG